MSTHWEGDGTHAEPEWVVGQQVRLVEADHVGDGLIGQVGTLTGFGQVFRTYYREHTFELQLPGHVTPIFAVKVEPVEEELADWERELLADAEPEDADDAYVEAEWVVGQQVSGSDYERLPVGSKVEMYGEIGKSVGNPQWTKRADGLWTDQAGVMGADLTETGEPRTLTYLPEHAEPEDATDAYVEPEPLKEGDPNAVTINTLDREEIHRLIRALVAKRVRLVIGPGDSVPSETINRVIEALREFANPKPARCTSLGAVSTSKDPILARCVRDDDGHEIHQDKHGMTWMTVNEVGHLAQLITEETES